MLALLALAACDPGVTVHVEPGSRADSLVVHAFLQSDSVKGGRTIYEVSVGGCARGDVVPLYWRIERTHQHRLTMLNDARTRFRYGELPGSEWTTVVPARPLTPGCYGVRAPGAGIGGNALFLVGEDGSVRAIDRLPAEYRERPRPVAAR